MVNLPTVKEETDIKRLYRIYGIDSSILLNIS